jgi:hypothetical protein
VNPDVRGPKVKQLVGLFGNTPCVWVSPPLWGNKDNGLLDVIRKSSTPCRYFDSNVHSPDLPRGSDKIHPTSEGQKKWAGSFVDWLQKERAGTEKPFRPQGPPGHRVGAAGSARENLAPVSWVAWDPRNRRGPARAGAREKKSISD